MTNRLAVQTAPDRRFTWPCAIAACGIMLQVVIRPQPRSVLSLLWPESRLAVRLAMVGLGSWVIGAVVTAVGQLGTEGGVLIGWVAVETGATVLVAGATVMLLSGHRDRRVAAEALFAIVGVWLLLTAVGMAGELASGFAPGWLWADGPLTAGTGAVYLAAGVSGWRHDRQRTSR